MPRAPRPAMLLPLIAAAALPACASPPRPAAPERRLTVADTLRRRVDVGAPIDDPGPPRRIRIPLTLRAQGSEFVHARVTWLGPENQTLAARPSPAATPLYAGRQTFLDLPAPAAAAGWMIEIAPGAPAAAP